MKSENMIAKAERNIERDLDMQIEDKNGYNKHKHSIQQDSSKFVLEARTIEYKKNQVPAPANLTILQFNYNPPKDNKVIENDVTDSNG